MKQTYLFDWGDTLMVDLPNKNGKMCDWDEVHIVAGAKSALRKLAADHQIYIATGAADSSAQDIELALARVNLSQYISGYFCQANLGVGKESGAYFSLIIDKLKLPAFSITMVGDSYSRDIEPALKLGMKAIWLNPNNLLIPQNCVSIASLYELCR